MSKIISIYQGDTEIEDLKKAFSKRGVSYILITCTPPSQTGNMEVEMSYEGDIDLICYLLEHAKNCLD